MARKRKRGKRTATGQLSRSKSAVTQRRQDAARERFEDGPTQVVLQARRRHKRGVRSIEADRKPVSKEQAKNMRLYDRGTILGNWLAEGKLTLEQVAVAGDYAARYEAYRRLNGLPSPTAKTASYSDAPRGAEDKRDRVRAAMMAKAAHDADQAKLRHCTAGTRQAMRRACITEDPAPLHLVVEGINSLMG